MKTPAMNPIAMMRSWLNSMHTAKVVGIGVELGLFGQLGDSVLKKDFIEQTGYHPPYVNAWLTAVQGAGIITIDSEGRIFWSSSEWRDAFTNSNSDSYVPPMVRCHLTIDRTYRKFLDFFRNGSGYKAETFDDELLKSIGGDGIRFANFFLNSAINAIPDLRNDLERGISVLDIGCGCGDFLIKIASHFTKSVFTGVDILPRAIELARGNVALKDNINFLQMNAAGLNENANRDLIIINEVLHEMDPNLRMGVLKACHRALKSGGRLFLVDILAPDNAADYSKQEFQLASLVQFFESPWGSQLLTFRELEKIVKQAGFRTLNKIIPSDAVIAAYLVRE